MWRLSKCTFFQSQIVASRDKELQKSLVYQSAELGAAAVRLDENNANAHKW